MEIVLVNAMIIKGNKQINRNALISYPTGMNYLFRSCSKHSRPGGGVVGTAIYGLYRYVLL